MGHARAAIGYIAAGRYLSAICRQLESMRLRMWVACVHTGISTECQHRTDQRMKTNLERCLNLNLGATEGSAFPHCCSLWDTHCPEIMAVRPHPLEVPGQRYHMLLHPEGDKIPHGYTVDDLKNLSGGLGKDGKPRLKLNTEKKSPPKMACHFCRNRKIACGTGKGKDKTCKYVILDL